MTPESPSPSEEEVSEKERKLNHYTAKEEGKSSIVKPGDPKRTLVLGGEEGRRIGYQSFEHEEPVSDVIS
jgi:hypothetical protein